MNPMCSVGLAEVCASAVWAGIMASRSGNASAVPTPRSTERRVRCFLVTNMNDSLFGCQLRPGRRLDGARLERRRVHDAHHNRREFIVVPLGIFYNLADTGHVVVLDAAA